MSGDLPVPETAITAAAQAIYPLTASLTHVSGNEMQHCERVARKALEAAAPHIDAAARAITDAEAKFREAVRDMLWPHVDLIFGASHYRAAVDAICAAAAQHLDAAARASEREPGTDVRFYDDDADLVAECPCGWHAHGDSATDAFRAWWKHRADEHAFADLIASERPVTPPEGTTP